MARRKAAVEQIPADDVPVPESVTINGRVWTIREVDATEMGDRTHDNDGALDTLGATFGQTFEILLANWQHPHLKRENLIHELMHAALFGAFPKALYDEDNDWEETYLSCLDTPFLSLLRENEEVLAYLLSDWGA